MRRSLPLALLMTLWALAATAFAYGKTAADIYPQTVTADTLCRLAEQHLARTLDGSGLGGRYVLEYVHAPKLLRLPDGELTFQVETPNGLRLWGNTSIQVSLIVDGVPSRKATVTYRIHLYDNVVVAARPLPADQPLTAGDVRLEEQEVGANGQRYFHDIAAVVGKVLGRPAPLGRALQRSMLKNPVIVQAGALVSIIASASGVEVQMEGMALEPGRVGELIRVRNTASKKIRQARVVDEQTVRVD